MDIAKIGEKIRDRRRELNLTQKDLADALHVSDRLVSKWETGESVPLLEYLQPLSEVLQVSVQSLMGMEEAPAAASAQTAVSEPPAATVSEPPAPKPKKPRKEKSFWREHKKELLISIVSGASAVFLTAVILLSVFVFAPAAGKKRYLEAIDKGIDRYLDLGYFNIRQTVDVDGEEDTRPDILQGYIDENGKVAFYNSVTDAVVKDGVQTYKVQSYNNPYKQCAYDQPASIKTVSDLLEMLLETWGDDDDEPWDIDKYVKYIRKTRHGYVMEFSDKFILDDLKPSEAKNIRVLKKIKGKVVMDGKKTKSIAVTVKFRNTKENENFTIATKIEFIQEKPIIEHENYVETVDTEIVEEERFLKLLNASSLDSLSYGTEDLLTSGKIHADNGYIVAPDGRYLYLYDPATMQKTTVTLSDSYGSVVKAATVYDGQIWYVIAPSSGKWELRHCDMSAKNSALMYDFSAMKTVAFNGKYFYCMPESSVNEGFAFDLQRRTRIATSNRIVYVDRAGKAYCKNPDNGVLYLYGSSGLVGSSGSLRGDYVLTEEDGYVYTADAEGIYKYKDGVYQQALPAVAEAVMQGGYFFEKDGRVLYDTDGKVVKTFSEIAVHRTPGLGYKVCTERIVAVWNGFAIVHLQSGNYDHDLGFYRIGEWDAPVAVCNGSYYYTYDESRILSSGDYTLCMLFDSSNNYRKRVWVAKRN